MRAELTIEGQDSGPDAGRVPLVDLQLERGPAPAGADVWLGSNVRLIPVEEVLFFQSDEKYTRVVTVETEALINLTQLSRRGLAELSKEALKLDRHARTTVADVFGSSKRAARGR